MKYWRMQKQKMWHFWLPAMCSGRFLFYSYSHRCSAHSLISLFLYNQLKNGSATTHIDLVIRSKELNIEVQVVHNASILTAVGCCGLQLYRFGEIVSIPLWSDTWKPTSYLDKIIENRKRGLHTLCLLGWLIEKF